MPHIILDAEKVILAIGSQPKTNPFPHIEEIPLTIALNPTKLADPGKSLIGGQVEYGGEGIEHDLMRSSPELYNSLIKLGNQEVNKLNFVYNNKDFTGNTWNKTNFDKYIIETPNAKFNRNIYNNFELFTTESIPTATILTVSTISFKSDNDIGSNVIDKNNNEYFKQIFVNIKKIIKAKDAPSILILDPLSLANATNNNIEEITKQYLEEITKIKDLDLTIIFIDSNKFINEDTNIYYKFFINFFSEENGKIYDMETNYLNTTNGGYLKNKTSRINKYKSPNNKKKNIKNTKRFKKCMGKGKDSCSSRKRLSY